jgi:hypothetical protein
MISAKLQDADDDFVDFSWLDSVQADNAVDSVVSMPTVGAKVVSLAMFMQQPTLLVIKTNKKIEVGVGSASRIVTILPYENRFGYLLLSSPSATTDLYFTSFEDDTSIVLLAIG